MFSNFYLMLEFENISTVSYYLGSTTSAGLLIYLGCSSWKQQQNIKTFILPDV